MEIEPKSSGQITAKKLWNLLRVIFTMVKKGISKSKIVMDLNMILKSCNQVASRAVNGLILQNHSPISRPNNEPNASIIGPNEYEFSCSSSPAIGPIQQYFTMGLKRPNKLNRRRRHYNFEDPTTVAAVHRVLEMIHSHEGPVVAPSPPFMGFGNGNGRGIGNKSPFVRQLRVTDSPFPLKNRKGNNKEEEEDIKVNKAADEFIQRFYRNLKMQRSLESPCHM